MRGIFHMRFVTFGPLRSIVLLALWAIASATYPAQAAQVHRIGLVHSYESTYVDAGRYRRTFEKELTARGIDYEIREYFLDCEELDYYPELEHAFRIIDDMAQWKVDAVAVFNNQAVYSLMKCGNPKLHDMKVVFSGVYCPDEELLALYPNITGYVDLPDYRRTIGMIERIAGPSRIVVVSGIGMINARIWKEIDTACRRMGVHAYDGDVMSHILAHRSLDEEEIRSEFADRPRNERIDTTVVMRMMCETLPLRTIQLTARGTQTFFMMTARTFSSLDAGQFFTNPSFATINEGFGSKDNMLGGYFVPLETQLKDHTEGIALRLNGGIPQSQTIQSRKEYVLNWHVLHRYGIAPDRIPAEYRIMYVPFTVRYRGQIVAGTAAGILFVLLVMAYLIHAMHRERRRKRQALDELRYEHETLLLAIGGATTYAWRRKDEALYFDAHFLRLVHLTGHIVTPQQILEFVHPDDAERFRERFLACGGNDHKQEYRCRFTGRYEWWEFRYSYLHVDGRMPEVTGMLQNIQEIKDREEELIRARRLAERAELKQSFLNNMSHEIRTPLNAIVGFSTLLAEDADLSEREKSDFSQLIRHNNDLLLKLINDVLELSRIDSRSVVFDLCDVDVRRLLETSYRTFSVQVKPRLTFVRDFPKDDAVLRTDAMRLQQVVANFLTNANKFTDRGTITLGYRRCDDDRTVRIFVKDTGKGIPPEELGMIFTRFYKRDEFAQGTGLGLAISHSIVERMNGRIAVESQVGVGSCFTIVLPLAEATANPED